MASMDYQQLVLDNEALLAELPSALQHRAGNQLVRSLPQLQAESSRFVSRQSKRSAVTGAGLAVAGADRFDLSKERRALDKIDLSSAYEDFEPSMDHNLERYLDYQQSLLVNTLIEENNGKIVQDFRDTYNARMAQIWQTQKNRLLRNLTIHFNEPVPDQHVAVEPLSTQETMPSALKMGLLTKESKYGQAVKEILHKRGHCAELFSKALLSFNEQTSSKDTAIIEIWRLIEEFTFASLQYGSTPCPYANLLQASIHFLEMQFRDWVASHLDKAKIGGMPGIANHIRAFIKTIVFKERYPTFMRTDFVNEVPLWPQLFYCLRSGALEEAVDLAAMASRLYPENAQLELLASCIGNAQPSEQQLQALSLDYNSFVRDESDPFAIAVYNIVSGGALETYDTLKYRQNPEYRSLFHRYITPSHTDYLWFSMYLLKSGDFIQNLEKFQSSIRGYEQHFSRNQTDPLLYFLVLLLSLQFPAAVVYSLSNPKFRVDNVHFALALDELGLLLPRDVKESEKQSITADVESILNDYVVENPESSVPIDAAVCYLVLVSDRHPEAFDRLFTKLLVGNAAPMDQIRTIQSIANKESGIARDLLRNDRVDLLCLTAAQLAANDESYLVASQLYQIAEPKPQEQYARTLVHLLDRHLLSLASPVRRLALEQSREILDDIEISPRVRDALGSLTQLALFFNANHAVRHDDALDIGSFNPQTNSGFVPLRSSDIQACLGQFDYVNSITSGALSRIFPELATAIIKILFNKHEMIRSYNKDTMRPQTMVSVYRDIRDQAQALHSYYVKLESQGIINSYSETFSKFYRGVCN